MDVFDQVDREITAGELMDWIEGRIATLNARNPHMRLYAVRDIDEAELSRLKAFKHELTELSVCASRGLTPLGSVETLMDDPDTPVDDAWNMAGTLNHAKIGMWQAQQKK